MPKNQEGALQDALRAIRYVRAMRENWNVDANRIGILGFSAGGSLSARVSTHYNENLYEPFDQVDEESARPDFSALIYPAYLDLGPEASLTPELKLDSNTPEMFLFVAADDKFANSSLVFGSALNQSKVPFELHIVRTGGHGYGMRQGNRADETWPNLCEEWLKLTALKPIAGSNR